MQCLLSDVLHDVYCGICQNSNFYSLGESVYYFGNTNPCCNFPLGCKVLPFYEEPPVGPHISYHQGFQGLHAVCTSVYFPQHDKGYWIFFSFFHQYKIFCNPSNHSVFTVSMPLPTVQILAEEAAAVEELDLAAARDILSKAQSAASTAASEEAKAEALITVEVAEELVKAAESG